jgi:non-heme chloroperoxidase
MKVEIKSITQNGIRMSYAVQGDPSGIPVLLLHGYTDSLYSYARALPHLPRMFHTHAVSQRGHGDSDRPSKGYRFDSFADDLAGLMDALDLGPAIVVGHSMSSSVARRFAIDYPERVRGLVLVGSFAAYRNNPAMEELWAAVSRLEDPIDPTFVREFQESTFARPIPPAFVDAVVRESTKLPAWAWRAVLGDQMNADFTSELDAIAAPTLIIWGDRDAFCPRSDQDKLMRRIAGSRLVIYDGTGHTPHWEEPRRFAADLVEFAQSIGAGREGFRGGELLPQRRAALPLAH